MNNLMTADPLKAQQYRTQRSENPEDLWQPLYDRANVAATTTVATQVAFFGTPKGQSATLITGTAAAAAKTKTYRDTNMENSNVVPTKMFKFTGISLAFVHRNPSGASSDTNAAERALILEGGYLQVRIVDKDILFLPLLAIPVLNPIAGVTGTSNFATNPGGGTGVAMYKLPIPVTLNPFENFSVTMNFDGTITTTASVDMYIFLQGFMRRPT